MVGKLRIEEIHTSILLYDEDIIIAQRTLELQLSPISAQCIDHIQMLNNIITNKRQKN